MKQAPWNSWRGLHEGDMAVELAEYDHALVASVVPCDGLLDRLIADYQKQAEDCPEAIRKSWWYAIGRHMGKEEKMV